MPTLQGFSGPMWSDSLRRLGNSACKFAPLAHWELQGFDSLAAHWVVITPFRRDTCPNTV